MCIICNNNKKNETRQIKSEIRLGPHEVLHEVCLRSKH